MFSKNGSKFVLSACAAILVSACTTSSKAPQISYDGLELMPDTRFAEVYMRPGIDLSVYQSYGITPCEVAFRKNWMRDQNSSRMNLSSRVSQKDVERIQKELGAQCEKFFREALEQEPPYKLVTTFNEGEAVLILRPSIVNLDINAPDIQSAGMQRTYTTEAGQMTLLLELVDSTTREVEVRIIDRKRSMDSSRLQWTNSVTNKSEADRMLRRWAGQLRKGLDLVTGHAPTK